MSDIDLDAFEFTVDKEFGTHRVYLGHNCDEWVIVNMDKSAAIAEFKKFIAEAENALKELTALP